MSQLTREQFESFRTQAEEAIRSFEKKDALLLSQQLEKQLAGLEIQDLALFSQAQKMFVQLRWMACQLLRDEREFLKLVRKNFLEGLELDQEEKVGPKALLNLLEGRFALQFGAGLEESLQRFLQALQENNQVLGSRTITVKGETASNRATVRRWLIDFLRSSPENPSEIDEADYLFGNANAQQLSEEERKLLGKILAFYDTFRFVLKELTRSRTQEKVELESFLPEETAPLAQSFASSNISRIPVPQTPVQKTLRESINENKEVLNQLLTINPIKTTETEELIGPTLRNWLADYLKEKGARLHEFSERNSYLTNNLNAKKLSPEERNVLAEILKAYDEPKTLLPFSSQTKQILVNELRHRETGQPEKTAPPPKTSPAFLTPSADRYREPVNPQDREPSPPLPPRPAPKISGNVIDLKEFGEK